MTTTMMPSLSLSISPSLSLPPVSPAALGARGAKAGDTAKAKEAVPFLSLDVAVYRGDKVKGLVLIEASKIRGAAARRRQKFLREMKEQEGSGGGGGGNSPLL